MSVPRSRLSLWRWKNSSALTLIRCISSSSRQAQAREKLVLGCGSNVVDHIYNVKVIPKAGAKGFFSSPFKALEKKLVGGVTLNHLSWAAFAGVPTGLLALQGQDDLGRFIRSNLKKLGVSTQFTRADFRFSSAQCHVFIQEDGEKSIVMAPTATSLITAEAVREYFDEAIQENAEMVTTEISQVPLSGVLALLESARRASVLSFLDVDVPPSVAINEALLGSREEVMECVRRADVLKPGKEAAVELLEILGSGVSQGCSLLEVARELIRLCGSKLVAITNGEKESVLATRDSAVEVTPPSIEEMVDSTGAGDAFLGGLVVGIRQNGLPNSPEDLKKLGRVANAYGATCVQSVGGVPTHKSSEILQQYLPEATNLSNGTLSRLHGFQTSLRNDMTAAAAVVEQVDHDSVARFLDIIEQCPGQLLTSGIGKSGLVAQRFASSLTSVGIPATFVHAAEWGHGDLGKARAGSDVALFLSNSGGTHECVVAASQLVARGVTTLAMTGKRDSKLSKLCAEHLAYDSKVLKEPFGCVPTSSLIVQEMLCNAIMCELIERKGVTKDVVRMSHPGGAIGAKLSTSS